MELMEQDVVVKVAESSVSEDFGKGFFLGSAVTLGVGVVVKLADKFVIKPIVKKIKKKKEEKEWEEACQTMDEIRKSKDDD